MPMLILLTVWQFGAPMVIFLAGLKQIPQELYEAGRSTAPEPCASSEDHAADALAGDLLQPAARDDPRVPDLRVGVHHLQRHRRPRRSTLFYTLYLYFRGFQDFQMGYASAMAWILVIVVGVIAAVFFWTSKHWVHYSGGQVMSTASSTNPPIVDASRTSSTTAPQSTERRGSARPADLILRRARSP